MVNKMFSAKGPSIHDEHAADREKLDHMLAKEDKTEQDPNNWAKVKKREAVTL